MEISATEESGRDDGRQQRCHDEEMPNLVEAGEDDRRADVDAMDDNAMMECDDKAKPDVAAADGHERSTGRADGDGRRRKGTPCLGLSVAKKQHRRGKKKKKAVDTDRGKKMPDAAPQNTTQFIMNDHSDTIQYLDQQLGVSKTSSNQPSPAPTPRSRRQVRHARDSSFSLESDEDFFYSSPEDEEEFVSKEFLNDYNRMKADRLVALSKSELINEYMQLESRIDILEKRLAKTRQRRVTRLKNMDFDISRGEVPMEPEVAEKIKIFQREIHILEVENQGLRRENQRLRRKHQMEERRIAEEGDSSHSSSSSGSSSCSTCTESSTELSDMEEEPQPANRADANATEKAAQPLESNAVNAQDTGYESCNSTEKASHHANSNTSASNAVEPKTDTGITSTSGT